MYMAFLEYLTRGRTKHLPPESGRPYDLGVVTRGHTDPLEIKTSFMEGQFRHEQPTFLYRQGLPHEDGATNGNGHKGKISEAYILIPKKGVVFVPRKPDYDGNNGQTPKSNPQTIKDALEVVLGLGNVWYIATRQEYVAGKDGSTAPQLAETKERVEVTGDVQEMLRAILQEGHFA